MKGAHPFVVHWLSLLCDACTSDQCRCVCVQVCVCVCAGVCVCVCVCVEVLWYSYHGTALMVCALFNKSAVSEVDICCMCGVCLCVWGGVGVCKRLAGKLVCERAVCVLCDRKW